ncbi:MAG: metallophosphoesterase [Phycisphaerales bacterium]|nr:MAG: metallophosphoesterase [Phycisphaerales bacterium]
MKRTLASIMIAAALTLWGATEAAAVPQLSFVGATPADGETVVGSSVGIEASIAESALADVTFNWNGTDYVIYDDSTVLMFNFDNVAALSEDYSAPGGLVKDVSNWDNDGTVGIGDDPTTVPEWLAGGRYGGAFDFAGNGSTYGQSILVIPHDSSLNPDSGDFAIAVWVRPRSDIDGDILRKGSTGTASTWYKLEHSPGTADNRFALNFNTDGTDATVNSPQAYNDDQWHFVVAQRRGNAAELWIDGSLVGSAGVSGSISNESNLTVGSKDTQADDFINATLDEVRIYMRSFTEDQMQVLYHSNLSKVGLDTWYFYVDQTNLASGDYTYQVSATSASLETGTAGPRTVTMDAPPIEAVIIKGPYLQQVTSSSIVIMWETDIAADSRVDFGGTYVEDATPVTIHEMQLTGLDPDTGYTYTVTSGTATSPASTFATAPASPRSFRFVAYGDTRTQPVEHAAVIQAIINSDPEIVIHTGDLVETGRDYTAWETEFFDPAYGLMIDTPMLPILGNHEYNGTGPLWFLDFFSLGNNDEWFAFTYGGVRFIGLNTCVDFSTGSTQYDWLVGELGSGEYASATWHVVYFHHPPYSATSSHGDDANVKQYLVPLFEQNGVDIVFNGHSHAYERYYNNGIYYIVTGGGGAPLAGLVTDNEEPIREYGESVYHHCTVDVDSGSLTVSAWYNEEGMEPFDTITIAKTAKASNPSPADGAENVPVDAVLSWKAGIDAVSHDVYFGTDEAAVADATPDSPEFRGNQEATSYDPGPLDPGVEYFWAIDEHDSGGTITYGYVWSFTTVPCLANGDVPVAGTVAGTYAATHASDNSYQTITEIKSQGKPPKLSYLEHKWTIDVPSGTKESMTFSVEAFCSDNSEGDTFDFAYSTDDVSYTDMLAVTKTADDDTSQSFDLPVTLSGTVYVRVTDTDRTANATSLDTIYVDRMYIQYAPGSPSYGVTVTIDEASQTVQPGGSTTFTVRVVNSGGLDASYAVAMSGTAVDDTTIVVTPLTWSTAVEPGSEEVHIVTVSTDDEYTLEDTYTLTATATCDQDGAVSDAATSELVVASQTNVLHVESVVVTLNERQAGKNTFVSGAARVTIVAVGTGQPVEGATVYGYWSGATTDIDSGVTDAEGVIVLYSDELKNPAGGTTFTFTADNVEKPGWQWDNETKSGNSTL